MLFYAIPNSLNSITKKKKKKKRNELIEFDNK